MIIPIRCFTCGKVLADKYDYYTIEVQKLQSKLDTEAETSKAVKDKPKDKEEADLYKHFDKLKSGKILDTLQLKRYCCRRMMLGTVDMMDFI